MQFDDATVRKLRLFNEAYLMLLRSIIIVKYRLNRNIAM